MNRKQVSFDDELLIVVDENDNVTDYKTKEECHRGKAILHRAFSVFIFNDENQLLVQQRSEEKTLWPLFWSNSCCSHPRRGETREEAAHRRIREELGMDTALKHLFTFTYYAPYNDHGSEREVCAVYAGHSNGPVNANPTEIADWKWMDIREVDRQLAEFPDRYSPWFRMEWKRIRENHSEEIEAIKSESAA